MSFPIDASRAFRLPRELQRLAAAVRDAGDYDETRWIEWKSRLDLTASHGRLHLIKQILGFANRDPQVAAQWAEGYSYLLVGVSPGSVKGVTAVDHQRLTQDLSPYVGDDVTWSPEYVRLDGVTVLVVVVTPPRPGDLIHFLRKDIPDQRGEGVLHREGTIFIRRHAESKVANHDERLMLQRRLRASAFEQERIQAERQERHERRTPQPPGQIIAELREGRATASLFGSINVPTGYRVIAEAQFATGGSTRIGLPSVLHPNRPYDFEIEKWPPGSTQPVTREIRLRFWPPIEGDDVDWWTCPCGRPTGESLDGPGHWEWRVPIVYNPPRAPASASIPPPEPQRRSLFR
jgi:hypothetical protein